MTTRKTASEKPARAPGRPRSSQPKADAARFLAALSAVELNPDSFASRAGIGRATAYRWIRTNTVPRWAWWIIELLQERRAAAAQFSRPAE